MLLLSLLLGKNTWASAQDFGTDGLDELLRLRQVWVYAQAHHSIGCSYMQSRDVDESSNQN